MGQAEQEPKLWVNIIPSQHEDQLKQGKGRMNVKKLYWDCDYLRIIQPIDLTDCCHLYQSENKYYKSSAEEIYRGEGSLAPGCDIEQTNQERNHTTDNSNDQAFQPGGVTKPKSNMYQEKITENFWARKSNFASAVQAVMADCPGKDWLEVGG